MKKLEDMSILVTGGGSGIGADCARRFCGQGARVTISGRRLEKLKAIKNELGERCRVVQGDVTLQADREAMLAADLAATEANNEVADLVSVLASLTASTVDDKGGLLSTPPPDETEAEGTSSSLEDV